MIMKPLFVVCVLTLATIGRSLLGVDETLEAVKENERINRRKSRSGGDAGEASTSLRQRINAARRTSGAGDEAPSAERNPPMKQMFKKKSTGIFGSRENVDPKTNQANMRSFLREEHREKGAQKDFLEKWVTALKQERDIKEGTFMKKIGPSWSANDYFDSFNKRMSAIAASCEATINFVSIGACDGTDDTTIKMFYDNPHWLGLFVEPMDNNLKDLKAAIEDKNATDRSTVIQAAASSKCKTPTLTFSRPLFEEIDKKNEHWLRRQIGGVIQKGARADWKDWRDESVRCTTVPQLEVEWAGELMRQKTAVLSRSVFAPKPKRTRPHIMRIDVEGHDYEVIKGMLQDSVKLAELPLTLMFEAKVVGVWHEDNTTFAQIKTMLEDVGYQVSGLHDDAFAVLLPDKIVVPGSRVNNHLENEITLGEYRRLRKFGASLLRKKPTKKASDTTADASTDTASSGDSSDGSSASTTSSGGSRSSSSRSSAKSSSTRASASASASEGSASSESGASEGGESKSKEENSSTDSSARQESAGRSRSSATGASTRPKSSTTGSVRSKASSSRPRQSEETREREKEDAGEPKPDSGDAEARVEARSSTSSGSKRVLKYGNPRGIKSSSAAQDLGLDGRSRSSAASAKRRKEKKDEED